ncbi:MAG: hypothetical protein A1D16_04900 [Flavihumibacter sp. CACIAM 22H1]|nr:MAG: hypothetical protein A1D16_04900 [Flavihumibacter sp. CACIAM 22H1]
MQQKYQPAQKAEKEPEKHTEPEDYQKTTTAPDGSFIYEKQKVAARYEQFRVKTDWEEPEAPGNLHNAPYVVALQGLIYAMIGELKRGEKIILDLLRDNFTQDGKPLQTHFEIPEKGSNGRKSDYERALLSLIGDIQKEIRDTAKKISILKNTM